MALTPQQLAQREAHEARQPGTDWANVPEHARLFGQSSSGATSPSPSVSSRPAPAASPAPVTPPTLAMPGMEASAGIAKVASDPTVGAAAVAPSVQALMDRADMGGISGDMGGQMRMLGQRMPSAESLALAGLGRKVY